MSSSKQETFQIAPDIADRVMEFRHALEWSREELGRVMGRSTRTIYNWERGNSVPPISSLIRIAKALDIDPKVFAEDGPWPGSVVFQAYPQGPSVGFVLEMSDGGPGAMASQKALEEVYRAGSDVFTEHLANEEDVSAETALRWFRRLYDLAIEGMRVAIATSADEGTETDVERRERIAKEDQADADAIQARSQPPDEDQAAGSA